MKATRIILAVLGLLDAVVLGRFVSSVSFFRLLPPDAPWWFQGLQVLRPFFLLSLGVSAIGLVLERRWGVILNYVQVPFRVAYVYLSFGFLTLLSVPLFGQSAYQPTMIGALVLEGLRLLVTIVVHVNLVKLPRE